MEATDTGLEERVQLLLAEMFQLVVHAGNQPENASQHIQRARDIKMEVLSLTRPALSAFAAASTKLPMEEAELDDGHSCAESHHAQPPQLSPENAAQELLTLKLLNALGDCDQKESMHEERDGAESPRAPSESSSADSRAIGLLDTDEDSVVGSGSAAPSIRRQMAVARRMEATREEQRMRKQLPLPLSPWSGSVSSRKGAKNHAFVCDVDGCGAVFNTRFSLKRHGKRHSGERPFHCEECGHRFAEKSTLLRHMRTHEDINAFACNQCGKRFSEQLARKHAAQHGVALHKAQLCKLDGCRRLFVTDTAFADHSLLAHGMTVAELQKMVRSAPRRAAAAAAAAAVCEP